MMLSPRKSKREPRWRKINLVICDAEGGLRTVVSEVKGRRNFVNNISVGSLHGENISRENRYMVYRLIQLKMLSEILLQNCVFFIARL